MDATELLRHKQALRAMIREAVVRKDAQQLEAVSTAVHDLELELLESFWVLNQLPRGVKPSPVSRLGRAFFVTCEELLRGVSVFLMAEGVSLAWTAARIRSRMKGEPVALDFANQRGRSSPLDADPNRWEGKTGR
jgi:hypothetical protein